MKLITATLFAGSLFPAADELPDLDNGQCAVLGADSERVGTMDGDRVESVRLFIAYNPISVSDGVCVLDLDVDQARRLHEVTGEFLEAHE